MLPEYGHSSAASASEQLYELIDGHAGVGDDAAEGARSDLLVVGHDNPNMRFVAAENHMGGESYGCHFGGGTRSLPVPGRLSLLGRTAR
jgi:hypothetical protein